MVAQRINSRSEFRCSVSSQNQFQLPELLVRELGFESERFYPVRGAIVAWYYHEGDDKVVLANDEVDRSSLELVGVSSLAGITNDDLTSGNVASAQITIITDIPDDLHTLLTRDAVVLKPIYASEHATLDGTCVSVYPAAEYDQGELPNVRRELVSPDEEEMSLSEEPSEVGTFDGHSNSV